MIDRPAHSVSLIVAMLAGLAAAVEAPATAQFQQLTRALELSGAVLSPLSLLYHSGVTLVVMAVSYVLLCAVWQRLAGSRQAGGSQSGPSS